MTDTVSRRDFIGVSGESVLIAAVGAGPPVPASAAASSGVGVLHAVDHGIVGDGLRDETAAVQRFLDHCMAASAGIAHFGGMRVRISGPLRVHALGIVFEGVGVRAGAPGFYVSGGGFTVLTVTGAVSDFCVNLAGVDPRAPGRLTADTRPEVNGVQFGLPDARTEFSLSHVRHVRVYGLAGVGVRHSLCWDSTFTNISVEFCGTAATPAFEVTGSRTDTCNESVWTRLQVEQAIGRAIRIDARTLSCTFTKIHSERAVGRTGAFTWEFGGSCEYGSVRLQADNPDVASVHFAGDQGRCTNLRAEGLTVSVDALGGCFRFDNPGATAMRSHPDQNGRIVVTGGRIGRLEAGSGWLLIGTSIEVLQGSFMPAGQSSAARDCAIGRVEPAAGHVTGAFRLARCTIARLQLSQGSGRLRSVELHDGTRATSPERGIVIDAQLVDVDAESLIVGDVRIAGGALHLRGTVQGSLSVDGPCRALAGQDAVVTGSVRNWGAPVTSVLLPTEGNGRLSKNLGSGAVEGWVRREGGWLPRRMAS